MPNNYNIELFKNGPNQDHCHIVQLVFPSVFNVDDQDSNSLTPNKRIIKNEGKKSGPKMHEPSKHKVH